MVPNITKNKSHSQTELAQLGSYLYLRGLKRRNGRAKTVAARLAAPIPRDTMQTELRQPIDPSDKPLKRFSISTSMQVLTTKT